MWQTRREAWREVHAATHCRAGSVAGLSVGWTAALDVLRSLHECERACLLSCYCDAHDVYFLNGVRAGRSRVHF